MRKQSDIYISCSTECNRMKGSSRCKKRIAGNNCPAIKFVEKNLNGSKLIQKKIIPLTV